MNDNEPNFSNTPYKATGNLNTAIGNPNININSAVTSNIMESNQSNVNSYGASSNNMSSVGNFVNNNIDTTNNNIGTTNTNTNTNIDINNNNINETLVQDDPVSAFINKVNESNVNTIQDSSDFISNSNSSVNTNSFDNISTNSFNSNSSEVRYENVYDTSKKVKGKQSIKIPGEFKTAIFVVLLLLIVLSCFETVYDFFRNLNIFG